MGLTGACANQAAPSGGPEDRRPPVVIRTEPDTFGELRERNASVRFHFDERISESVAGGDLSEAVLVSPRTGEVRVSHGRSSITVSLEGGFEPGLLYRVTLLPVVGDMFGNPMRDAFELVFTTGGDPAPTATVAGEVWDRVSGEGLNGATVEAVGPDSLVHVARADPEGVFAFRYLPTGDFRLTGYDDRDRNRQLGDQEPSGALPTSISEGDTLIVAIPVLVPDTTPATPGGALALDSVTIVVEFDDYLDPGAAIEQVDVSLTREGVEAPSVVRLLHEHEYGSYVDQIADSLARLDSIDAAVRAEAEAAVAAAAAADAARDSVAGVVGDTLSPAAADAADPTVTDTIVEASVDSAGADAVAIDGAAVEDGPGSRRDAAVEAVQARPTPPRLDGAPNQTRLGVVLPGRRLVGLLDLPLDTGEYRVRVSPVVNINGLTGGGGEITLVYEPPPTPVDSVPADADGVAPGDSVTARDPAVADTVGAPGE